MTTDQCASAPNLSVAAAPSWEYRRRRRHLFWTDEGYARVKASGGGEVRAICGVIVRVSAGPVGPAVVVPRRDHCPTCLDLSDRSAVIRL